MMAHRSDWISGFKLRSDLWTLACLSVAGLCHESDRGVYIFIKSTGKTKQERCFLKRKNETKPCCFTAIGNKRIGVRWYDYAKLKSNLRFSECLIKVSLTSTLKPL